MSGQSQGWKCEHCGFVNPRSYYRCVTCLRPRTYVKPQSVDSRSES